MLRDDVHGSQQVLIVELPLAAVRPGHALQPAAGGELAARGQDAVGHDREAGVGGLVAAGLSEDLVETELAPELVEQPDAADVASAVGLEIAEIDEWRCDQAGDGAAQRLQLGSDVLIAAEVGDGLLDDLAGVGVAVTLGEIPVDAGAADYLAKEHAG